MQSGMHRFPAMEEVVFGRPFAAALAGEVERLQARSVFLLVGGTLSRETDVLAQLRDALGDRVAGVWNRMGAHTPRTDVVAAANAAREAKADLIATLGGGSVTDGAKMVELCLANDVTEPAQLDAFVGRLDRERTGDAMRAPGVRGISIPTTLSAGEFSSIAGCTDTERGIKQGYVHPLLIPRAVILDPAATVHTPEWLFLSTGVRALDHAIEGLCSSAPAPFADGASVHALRLLGRGLPRVKADPADLEARLDCQLGAWMSMVGVGSGVPMGASHGIGHVLGGTGGMPHGYTSCVMAPHILRFNAEVRGERQHWISEALGQPGRPAAEVVGALIAGLGMPTRLRDAGLDRALLDRIAEESVHDPWVPANPRPIEQPSVVRKLLEQAW